MVMRMVVTSSRESPSPYEITSRGISISQQDYNCLGNKKFIILVDECNGSYKQLFIDDQP